MKRLDLSKAVRAVGAPGKYHADLSALRTRGASGVYAIIDKKTRDVLYIGESHTGRLYDTITRHFREWSTPTDRNGRREGGVQYERAAVLVTWLTCPGDQAQDIQYAEIQRLQPADNTFDGATIATNPPTQRPGPLKPGARVRVRSIVYEAGGQLYRHDFKPSDPGTIRLPRGSVRNGWIQ